MNVDLKGLIEKLNPTCRKALEGAAGLCVAETHYNVEVEHFLSRLLDLPPAPETDLQRILRYYEVDSKTIAHEFSATLRTFERGNGRTPAMSPQVVQLLREAWLRTSLDWKDGAIRSGALLLALLDHDQLRASILQSAPGLGRISREALRQDVGELVRGSGEDGAPPARTARSARAGETGPADAGTPGPVGETFATPALDLYTIDLTARARAGLIDPIRGRDLEIRQVIDILTRRRQNTPSLPGEAGVGKTAVVEGFALRIAAGAVPPAHRNVSLRLLDLGLLQAGAGIKGEFENRLRSVIDEVKGSPTPIILFIDEAHTMIGAGGAAGQGDAANLLKPALARGELRTIAATTWAEYKRYFEKDPALARRFQVVKVDEPDEPTAIDMLRGLASHLESHHGVRVLDEAVRGAVTLSHRYIPGRQLPDKAISVLDTACARVALAQNGTPEAIEAVARDMLTIETERASLKRERAMGHPDAGGHGNHDGQEVGAAEALATELGLLEARHRSLAARWKRELKLVKQIRKIEDELTSRAEAELPDPAGAERALRQGERLARLREELGAVQGEEPMVPVAVDARAVASVVSAWTGIPTGEMQLDEVRAVLSLEAKLAERIVGQPQALDAISRRIRTSRAKLDDPGKPIGVFLLVGPSGVGKTETALTLAEILYGGERSLVVVNMSEFQEAHTVSTLKGAPPGYVGYGSGGVLTEAVRRRPYSVILLDEMEKAHPDVAEIFYQVFDKGTLEDGEGVVVDFKNTVILMTSNAGAEVIARLCREERPERLSEEIRPALLKHFKPAFLGRLVTVPYYPLGDAQIREIVELKLAKVRQRVRDSHRAELTYGEELVDAIASRCTEVDSGARNIDHILTQTLLPEMASALLGRIALGLGFSGIHVSAGDTPGGTF
ncbi:MAG TPA: type VI secretion system ATPase TssH, partial [Thermoanaerobaculia bacterium]|nr:type VI secretion system ATPase TssH [Thermoanaerobaculia bacterium]